MNKQIKLLAKAAELAEGWAWETEDDGYYLVGPDMGWHQHCISQGAKDGLAAQLVRQVDATDKYMVYEYPIASEVVIEDCSNDDFVTNINGPDRTMNTIKAIVDSKVLK